MRSARPRYGTVHVEAVCDRCAVRIIRPLRGGRWIHLASGAVECPRTPGHPPARAQARGEPSTINMIHSFDLYLVSHSCLITVSKKWDRMGWEKRGVEGRENKNKVRPKASRTLRTPCF